MVLAAIMLLNRRNAWYREPEWMRFAAQVGEFMAAVGLATYGGSRIKSSGKKHTIIEVGPNKGRPPKRYIHDYFKQRKKRSTGDYEEKKEEKEEKENLPGEEKRAGAQDKSFRYMAYGKKRGRRGKTPKGRKRMFRKRSRSTRVGRRVISRVNKRVARQMYNTMNKIARKAVWQNRMKMNTLKHHSIGTALYTSVVNEVTWFHFGLLNSSQIETFLQETIQYHRYKTGVDPSKSIQESDYTTQDPASMGDMRYAIHSAWRKITIRNDNNTDVVLDWWHVVPKIRSNGSPQLDLQTWVEAARYDNKTTSVLVRPELSGEFMKEWKILRKGCVVLKPGDVKTYFLKRKKPFYYSPKRYDVHSVYDNYPGVTQHMMFRMKGNLVSADVDHEKIGFNKAELITCAELWARVNPMLNQFNTSVHDSISLGDFSVDPPKEHGPQVDENVMEADA